MTVWKKVDVNYNSFDIVNDHFSKDNEHVYMHDYKSDWFVPLEQ